MSVVTALMELDEFVASNTDWKTEIPHKTGLHRMNCIAEHIIEMVGKVAVEVTDKYVALPTDSNDEVVHVGDVMSGWEGYYGNDNTMDVTELRYGTDGWMAVHVDEDGSEWVSEVSNMSHYKPLTLEDVLRMFAGAYAEQMNVPTTWRTPVSDDILERYTKAIEEVVVTDEETTDEPEGSDQP